MSKKPFQKELAMQGLTFDPGQRRVLLLVLHINILLDKAFVQTRFYFFTDSKFMINDLAYHICDGDSIPKPNFIKLFYRRNL